MPLRSGKLLKNRYTILAALAPGGFSRVYHARDETRAHEVAIKELDFADDRAAKRFFGEFQTMMLLRHPNIVEVHEIIEDEGGYYMVMEYMAGGSLADALDRGEKFSIERAIEIVGTVGRALAYAHAHRVVHCDIKPANILFAADRTAKLADFGIAHISELLKAFAWTMTPHSFIAGTVQYMPPEQVDGVRDDPRIDVYSLGAALYQMLAGHDYLNFDRRKIPAAAATNIHLIKTAVPLPPSAHNAAIPPWLDEIILSALAKERAERYDSIDDFLETLTRAQDEERERRVEFSAPAQIAEQIESPTEFVEPRTESREELASPESLRAPITPTRRPSRAVWAGGIVVMIGIVILFVGGIGTARLLTENNAAGKVAAISESQITQEATLVPITTATTTATATLSSVTLPIRTFTASPTQRGTITQTRTTTRASSPTTAAPGATDLSGFRDPGTTFILTEAYIVLGSGAFAFDLKSDSGFKYSAPKITLENQSGKRLSNNEFHFAKFEIPSFSWGSVGGLTSEEYYFADIRGGGSRCMLLTRNITIKLPPAKSLCYTLDSNGTIYILKVSTVWQRADGKIQQIGPDSGELYFSWGPD